MSLLCVRPPTSNAERQRQFRERNPDYYRLLQAKRRGRVKAYSAQLRAAERATAAQSVPLALPAPVEMPAIPTRLALPAPVEQLVFPALNPLEAKQRETVPLERSIAA